MGKSSMGLEHFIRQDRSTFEVNGDLPGAIRGFLKASRPVLAGLKERSQYAKRSEQRRSKMAASRRRGRRVAEAIQRRQGTR